MEKKTRKEKMLNFFVMILNYLTLFIPALLKRWVANINKNKQVDKKVKENHDNIKKSIKNAKKK